MAAFVPMPGRSSDSGGRWTRWHPQAGDRQRKTTAYQQEEGVLNGHGAAPIYQALFLDQMWIEWGTVLIAFFFLPSSEEQEHKPPVY